MQKTQQEDTKLQEKQNAKEANIEEKNGQTIKSMK